MLADVRGHRRYLLSSMEATASARQSDQRTQRVLYALILYRRRRFINHLLTYLLTYLLYCELENNWTLDGRCI